MQLRCGQQQQQGLRDVRTRAAASALIRTPLPNNARPLKPRTQQDRRSLEQLESEKQMCNLISKYTPEYVRSRALETPADAFAVMARVAHIVTGLGTYFGCLAFDRLTGTEDNIETVRRRAQQLRETLTELGPSFIKAGQVLANRPDIVREDYMNELCILQDDVPPFPDEEAFAIIQEQLGRPLEAVFSSISEQPVAAASLGQVYKAVLRDSGEEVAVKVQRPGIEPLILRDLYVFRALGSLFNAFSQQRLGCNAELVVDEFGEKLLEELDYMQEARNIEEFGRNFASDPTVKIPWVRRDLCGSKVVVMEWIEGIRCTDIPGIRNSGIDVDEFIRVGVVSGLRQLLEFGLFHGDPHPGNIFCLRDGRIAYVDFGNVAQLSNSNKQVLIDAVVHAVNEDYEEMAGDFIKLGFLSPGTDITPIVPALEKIWRDSKGQQLADFNFRTVTSKFNELVYQYPIRIPERYSLVIRSLLTQEGICMTLEPEFHFLEVAYPYVARRLLTDEDPALRERLIQVLFQGGKFQWARLTNLIQLAREGGSGIAASAAASAAASRSASPINGSSSSTGLVRAPKAGLDLSDTVRDAARLLLLDEKLRRQVLMALTEDNQLHVEEVRQVLSLLQDDVSPGRLATQVVRDLPSIGRQVMLSWADKVLVS
uniref:Protein kinase domain-containing protein n=1 Tax=Tetradesmus obliquus TaxID=3088 RepID=A0A383V4T5_TETOB|eukprot:jgi/Sobl393_1/14372/SZX60627.1